MSEIKARDVVRVRHPFFITRKWRVMQVLPSVNGDLWLYRIQLLERDGSEDLRFRPIAVTAEYITQNLGGYDEWLEILKKS